MAREIFIYNPTYSETTDKSEDVFIDGTTKYNKKFDLQDWVREIIEEYGTGNIAGITSVFGRTGAIIAVGGDYSASQITNVPSGTIASGNVQAALNELGTEKVSGNLPIGPSTRTKVAYDDKGLVTAGYDATTLDILEDTNLYFTEARVKNTVLTGLATNVAGPVLSTDTVLQALGKLQNTFLQQTKYVQNFLFTDWIVGATTATLTILQAVHLKGLNPVCVVKETLGGSSANVLVDIVSNDLTGDITLTINSTDIFSGKIIIL